MSTATTDPEELVDFDDAVLVAPNWKLVWWRLKSTDWRFIRVLS